MKTFSYCAMDARGREKQGTVEVNDQREAIDRLHEMGFFPTKVSEVRPPDRGGITRGHAPKPSSFAPRRCRIEFIHRLTHRIGSGALASFTGELATLIDAGLPLLQSLRVLEQQESHRRLRQIIATMARDIESGNTFSEALARHPSVFSPLYISLAQAGEVGGVLDQVLERLAQFMEKALRIRGKVIAAMMYPCAVLLIAFAILSLLMVYVVPGFRDQFREILGGGALPPFTEMVFGLSSTVQRHLLIFFATPLALLGLVVAGCRTKPGRRWLDRIKIGAPIFGVVLRKVALARFTRTLGTLMGSGVPVLQALMVTKQAAGNVLIGQAIEAIHRSVKEGGTMAEPLAASRLFPATLISLVNVGEQTGALPEMLLKVSDKYDTDVDHAVTAMTALVEPVMIVLLAVVVGGIVIALYLPLIAFATQFGQDHDATATDL